jgi:hypothetical protein
MILNEYIVYDWCICWCIIFNESSNAQCNNKDTYLYVHLCTKVPLCSDTELKGAPVDVPNWSSCMVGTLEKPNSRHNESYKPKPSLKLQGLLF